MKRFHVHVSVTDLPQSIGFYSRLFGTGPVVTKTDYAKWMLDDPSINFAISNREGKAGLNHLGFQVDTDEELTELRQQAHKAQIAVVEELGAACCYAKSDKHWIEDPQGIAWEAFRTLGDIPVFGAPAVKTEAPSTCCAPKESATPVTVQRACRG